MAAGTRRFEFAMGNVLVRIDEFCGGFGVGAEGGIEVRSKIGSFKSCAVVWVQVIFYESCGGKRSLTKSGFRFAVCLIVYSRRLDVHTSLLKLLQCRHIVLR